VKIQVPIGHSLREVNDSDASWLVELHNDPYVLNNLTTNIPITLESHLKWFESIKINRSEKRLIYTINGENVGFTKFYSIDKLNKNCVLGADIHQDFRGKGLAKYMWTLMLEYCFNELQLHRVSLTTAEYNDIAQQVYKKLGFIIEGILYESLLRNDVWYNQLLMSLTYTQWVT
jgi:diamine N-acetyltransferase